MNKLKKIHKTSLNIENWHQVANIVLYTDGICTTISTQSNNLLQKIIVKYDKENKKSSKTR